MEITDSLTVPPVLTKARLKPRSAADEAVYFQATPPMLHFGGFAIGQQYTLAVNVVNVGRESNRMKVLHPTTAFKVAQSRNIPHI